MLSKSKVKYIQSLGDKKQRDTEGLFVVEGPKMVTELLTANAADLVALYGTTAWLDSIDHHLEGIEVSELSTEELSRISQLQTPNQVLAIVRKPSFSKEKVSGTLTLALDTIQDPGNLGTIIRIADWFGVQQVVCSIECADAFNPKVVQATMGSIMRVPVTYVNLVEWLQEHNDVASYAAALNGTDVKTMQPLKEGIFVIGNESKGISSEVLQQVKNKITIPGKGKAESLNAAVAAGIILSHLS